MCMKLIPCTGKILAYNKVYLFWKTRKKKPIRNYVEKSISMYGRLIRYGSNPANVAFLSSGSKGFDSEHHGKFYKKVLIAVGGLSCGLLFASYVEELAATLPERTGWAVVQPLLSSCHSGWGMGSVSEDAREIHQLVGVLSSEYGCEHVILLGHSTGCQDAMMYAKRYGLLLRGVILQGPVSDREFFRGYLGETKYTSLISLSRDMLKKGRGEEVAFVFREWNSVVPVSARRWLSLSDVGGEDDMFSSDFSEQSLADTMRSLQNIHTLVLMSGADECQVPYGVDPAEMGQRLKDAIGGSSAKLCVIEGGSHDLSHNVREASEVIIEFIASV